MKIKLILALLTLGSTSAFANINTNVTPQHGFISAPSSRAILCQQGENKDCGTVVWEPQSVEGPKGFPQSGPRDGEIASGGSRFVKLDEYGPTRWTKVKMKAGKQTFKWGLTASHRTTSWEFFITKQDWDPNKPLSRKSFNLKPFCEQFDGGAMPKTTVEINCNVPKRTGYQQILGVWTIADTGNAFYQIIDAQFPTK